jgi:hypothetical protein
MGEVLNLRQARKRAARQRKEQRAEANRLLHGVSKAERTLGVARATKSHRDLDGHRVTTGESDEIAGR